MRSSFFLIVSILAATTVHAVDLRFQTMVGDVFRLDGEGEQIVFLNGAQLQRNTNLSRTIYKVTAVDADEAHFSVHSDFTSQRKDSKVASEAKDTMEWVFSRDALGHFNVSSDSTDPVVRNIPVFPGHEVNVGDTWSAPGEEVEDLSSMGAFRINSKPLPALHIATPVSYRYQGNETKDGKTLRVIEVDYSLFYRTDFSKDQYKVFPLLVSGHTKQRVLFNQSEGIEDSYNEEYTLDLVLSNGDFYEFKGTSKANLADATLQERPVVAKVEQPTPVPASAAANGNGHGYVRAAVLSMEGIMFAADSDVLSDTEKEKLQAIGQVLAQYPDRDILIEGSTARSGTPEDQKRLSEKRAVAVGEFLVEIGARKQQQIIYRGLGASLAPDGSDGEQDKQRSRRVEITVLEN